MEFFQGLGIFCFCLLVCLVIFLSLLVLTKCDLEDAFVIYAILISILISLMISNFIVHPENAGYQLIEKEEQEESK